MKKGFTLIELLAVVVILAIIAIIAVPTVAKVVEKARKGAAEASALNYIDAVEKYIILHDMNPTKYPYDIKGGTFNVAESTEVSLLDIIIPKAKAEETIPSLNSFITVKGDKPKSGTITTNEKGKVTEANIEIKGYSVACTGDSCETSGGSSTPQISLSINTPESTDLNVSDTLTLTVTTNSSDSITWSSSDNTIATVSNGVVTGVNTGSVTITATIGSVSDTIELTIKGGPTTDLFDIYSSANVKQLGVLGIVYLNPTTGHLTDLCNADNTTAGPVVSNNVIDTNRCMKWYVYAEDTTNNTYTMILDHNVADVVWSTFNNPPNSYSGSGAKTVIDSLNWDSSIIEKRIISTGELHTISGRSFSTSGTSSDFLDGTTKSGQGTSSYGWLFENLNACTSYGCDITSSSVNSYYWTSDRKAGKVVFSVSYAGQVGSNTWSNETHGVRPVIVIPKSILN